jgi:hypothetical protein
MRGEGRPRGYRRHGSSHDASVVNLVIWPLPIKSARIHLAFGTPPREDRGKFYFERITVGSRSPIGQVHFDMIASIDVGAGSSDAAVISP